eukprot:COSAG02_NODE_31207_length_537_cov_1.168950_1_plen_157_part_10
MLSPPSSLHLHQHVQPRYPAEIDTIRRLRGSVDSQGAVIPGDPTPVTDHRMRGRAPVHVSASGRVRAGEDTCRDCDEHARSASTRVEQDAGASTNSRTTAGNDETSAHTHPPPPQRLARPPDSTHHHHPASTPRLRPTTPCFDSTQQLSCSSSPAPP